MNQLSKYLFSMLVLIFSIHSFIDANQTDTIGQKKSILINTGLISFSELNVGYENFLLKNHPRISLIGTLGYKFRGNKESFHNTSTDYFVDFFSYFWSNSVYSSISLRRYFDNSPTSPYFEIAPFYRVNYYNKKIMHYDDGQDGSRILIYKLQSATQNNIGIKFLIGFKSYFLPNNKNKFNWDFYFGPGARIKYVNKTTYDVTQTWTGLSYPQPQYPIKEKFKYFYPAFHLGIKLGFGWIGKSKL